MLFPRCCANSITPNLAASLKDASVRPEWESWRRVVRWRKEDGANAPTYPCLAKWVCKKSRSRRQRGITCRALRLRDAFIGETLRREEVLICIWTSIADDHEKIAQRWSDAGREGKCQRAVGAGLIRETKHHLSICLVTRTPTDFSRSSGGTKRRSHSRRANAGEGFELGIRNGYFKSEATALVGRWRRSTSTLGTRTSRIAKPRGRKADM